MRRSRAGASPTEGTGLRSFAERPEARAALGRLVQPPPEVTAWLSRLRLLYGLPFDHLAPHDGLLPVESIRFFHVDPGWLDALEDGALSVGAGSSSDEALTSVLGVTARHAVREKARGLRRRLLGRPDSTAERADGPQAGFLLRSEVVADWPGLQVVAYDGDGAPLEIARLERLAPDVLLCIVDGIPHRIDLQQPSEGLHFGVRSDDGILPRGLGALGRRTAEPLTTDPAEFARAAFHGDREQRILDVLETRRRLTERLVTLGAIEAGRQLGPADFAVEIVHAPAVQPFEREGSSPPAPAAPAAQRVEEMIDEATLLRDLLEAMGDDA